MGVGETQATQEYVSTGQGMRETGVKKGERGEDGREGMIESGRAIEEGGGERWRRQGGKEEGRQWDGRIRSEEGRRDGGMFSPGTEERLEEGRRSLRAHPQSELKL